MVQTIPMVNSMVTDVGIGWLGAQAFEGVARAEDQSNATPTKLIVVTPVPEEPHEELQRWLDETGYTLD